MACDSGGHAGRAYGDGRIDMAMATATARPRPQVMRLTEAAASRIRDLMDQSGRPIAGLRVGVRNGGCAGMAYTMEYAEAIHPTDEVVEDKGVKILIDPKAVLFLGKCGGLKRKNPQATSRWKQFHPRSESLPSQCRPSPTPGCVNRDVRPHPRRPRRGGRGTTRWRRAPPRRSARRPRRPRRIPGPPRHSRPFFSWPPPPSRTSP